MCDVPRFVARKYALAPADHFRAVQMTQDGREPRPARTHSKMTGLRPAIAPTRFLPSQQDADRINLSLLGRINRPANMIGRTP